MKYTPKEESRIIEILEDFNKPTNRYYFGLIGFKYNSLNNASLKTPGQHIRDIEENMSPYEEGFKVDENGKLELIPFRFSDEYLRGLLMEGDRALILAEILIQGERQGLEYRLVTNNMTKGSSLFELEQHKFHEQAIKEIVEQKKEFAKSLLDNRVYVQNAGVQRVVNQILNSTHTIEPLAWFEPKPSLKSSRRVEVFAIRHANQRSYDNFHIADNMQEKLCNLTFQYPGKPFEQELVRLGDYLKTGKEN